MVTSFCIYIGVKIDYAKVKSEYSKWESSGRGEDRFLVGSVVNTKRGVYKVIYNRWDMSIRINLVNQMDAYILRIIDTE